jgi:peptidoglycan hydrolase-like protein with peptidoglycan-binding domain
MKNLKIKVLTLGVLATLVVASTPTFAATKNSTNTPATNKTITASNINKASTVPTIPGTIKTASNPTVGYGYTTSGPAVATLQSALNRYGYNLAVDGQFGSNTYSALVNFQYTHGLSADGICGPNTWAALGY